MPTATINYWAVLLAAAINMGLGSLWYSKFMFADRWMKSINKKQEDLGEPGPAMALMVVGALLQAYILAHFVYYAQATTLVDGARTGLWIWLGFIAPVALGIKMFENRPWDWYILNVGYYLLILMINGALLATWVK